MYGWVEYLSQCDVMHMIRVEPALHAHEAVRKLLKSVTEKIAFFSILLSVK